MGVRHHRDDVAVQRRPGRQQCGAGSAEGGASGGEMERAEREDKIERGGATFIYETKTLVAMG
jgi:hypothetical protein